MAWEAKPPRLNFRTAVPRGTWCRRSAANRVHPAADNNYYFHRHRRAIGTDNSRTMNFQHIPSKIRTATWDSHARWDSDRAHQPSVGPYPPVRRACLQRRCSCTRCRRCSWPVDDACQCPRRCCSRDPRPVVVAIGAAVASCCERCCSRTDLPSCRCPTRRMARPSHFWDVVRELDSGIPVRWIKI